MGTNNKANVRTVISHVEGSAGNFLGRLAANWSDFPDDVFRVDIDANEDVLAIDGRQNWHQEIDCRLDQHRVVVTHSFDRDSIMRTFPNAKMIALYPYTHLGNVLYNICCKKLTVKLENTVDNHFIHLSEWHERITHYRPNYQCHDFWALRNIDEIQDILSMRLNSRQREFFDAYWKNQLLLDLDIPTKPMRINELIDFWKITTQFDSWFIALVIYVFEKVNGLSEHDRSWSIDQAHKFISWQDLVDIEIQYRS